MGKVNMTIKFTKSMEWDFNRYTKNLYKPVLTKKQIVIDFLGKIPGMLFDVLIGVITALGNKRMTNAKIRDREKYDPITNLFSPAFSENFRAYDNEIYFHNKRRKPEEYEFTKEGLYKSYNKDYKLLCTWKNMYKLAEENKYLYLYTNPTDVLIIPKKCISGEADLIQLKDFYLISKNQKGEQM